LETVIEVSNLSKQYRLGFVGTTSIADDIKKYWSKIKGKDDPTIKVGQSNVLSHKLTKAEDDYVWALKDLNFDVKQGEVLGIIGKNGAGKSTLLKILSKVTTPTKGCVKVKGRIASLLEIGTGFHGDLSGRENIFINGAILGMSKAEIKNKFDEIVDFSGVERYIDTPVKRYSSGMYVRLAFAVAAHLEPEILIVDEVLAVGDAEFQKKCLGKMKDVSVREGRTVLFVSHNMMAIDNLCTRCMLLKQGSLNDVGNTKEVVRKYLSESLDFDRNNITAEKFPRDFKKYSERAIIYSMKMDKEKMLWKEKPSFTFNVQIKDARLTTIEFGFGINSSSGLRIFTYESNKSYNVNDRGMLSFKVRINEPTLVPSKYYISLGIRSNIQTLDAIESYLEFEIIDYDKENNHFGFTLGAENSGYIDTNVNVEEI